MKTEHFDAAFKHKAAAIQSQHSEDDIDRVHAYVNKHRSSPAFWAIYGNAIALSLLGFIATTLITLNAMQFQNQKLLLKKIDLLEKHIAWVEENLSATKTDTIRIIKYITRDESLHTQHNSETAYRSYLTDQEKHFIRNKNTITNYTNSIKHGSKKYTYYISDKSDFENQYTQSITRKPMHKDAFTYPSAKMHSTIEIYSQKPLMHDSGYTAYTYQTLNYLKKSTVKSENGKNNILLEKDNTKPQILLAKQSDSILVKPIIKDSILQANETEKTKLNKTASFNKLNYRGGITVQKGNGESAIGLTAEVLLNRFGLGFGINTLFAADPYKMSNDSYANKKDWLSATHAAYISDTSNISDIQVKTTVLQIPVAINYYMPLRNNFSLLFSIGTNLEIYARQHIHYDKYANNTIMEENKNISYPTVFFNNLNLAAGVQKQWNRTTLQMTPYTSVQIKNVSYKRDVLNFGLKLKLLYNF